jgi:hypothetical protein
MSIFKSVTGLTINDPNVCVKGSTFACLCSSCEAEKNERVAMIMRGETPEGVTEESARAWQEIFSSTHPTSEISD